MSFLSIAGATATVSILINALCTTAFAVTLTLNEISKIAIENSDLLKAQLRQIDADVLRTEGTGLLPNPTFAFQLGQLQSGGDQGPLVEIGLFQPVPFPGKLSSLKKLSNLQKELAQLQGKELTRLVQHEVTILAVKLEALKELAKHSDERAKRFQLIQNYIDTHPLVSPSQKAEAALAENQVRILEKSILELEEEQKLVDIGLQFFLKLNEPLQPVFSWLTTPNLPTLHQLEEVLYTEGIDLQKQNTDVKIAQTQLTKARLDRFPDVMLGASYRKESIPPPTYFYTGFLTLTLPIWDHGQYSVPSAQARLESQEFYKINLKRQLYRQLQELYLKTETSSKRIRSFPPSLQKKVESQFEHAAKEFQKNRITFSQLLQLDAQIHDTLDAVYRSQLDYLENLSHLLLFVGRPLEWT